MIRRDMSPSCYPSYLRKLGARLPLLGILVPGLLGCAYVQSLVESRLSEPGETPLASAPSPPPTPTSQPPPPPSVTPPPTVSPAAPSAGIEGVIFFDRDGDGLQGIEEMGVPGAQVCVRAADGDSCAATNPEGEYALEGIPPGLRQIQVSGPGEDLQNTYRYTNLFKGWVDLPSYQINGVWVPDQRLPETELKPISELLEVNIDLERNLNIGLTQGSLTDIFKCGDREKILTFQYFDLDPRPGYVRHFSEPEPRGPGEDGDTVLRGDNHFAIDWGDSSTSIIGAPLLAPANGVVVFAGDGMTWNGLCRVVNLVHPETGASSGIVHLETVLVDDRWDVRRGQILGTLGKSCTTWPHVHFYFKPGWDPASSAWEGSDPYRDSADPDSTTNWTVDNEPVCFGGEG